MCNCFYPNRCPYCGHRMYPYYVETYPWRQIAPWVNPFPQPRPILKERIIREEVRYPRRTTVGDALKLAHSALT